MTSLVAAKMLPRRLLITRSVHAIGRMTLTRPALASYKPATATNAFSTTSAAWAEATQKRQPSAATLKKREAAKEKREKAKLRAQEAREKEKLKKQRQKERQKELKAKERERAKVKREKERAATKQKARRTTKLTPPKAPQNSWSIFLQDYIESYKANNPGSKDSVSQLTKAAAPKYHELSADERAALNERAQQQKEAYPAIYEEWKNSLTPEMIREENAVRQRRRKLGLAHKRNLRLSDEPRRPLTAFLRFSTSVHHDSTKSYILNGEQDVIKASKLIASAWREMSPEEKEPYESAAREDVERYLREKKEWEQKHGIAK